ncbi:C40 family peptidase [[Phormidium] sp. ETS-05]|uniref:C40 family peptidase n=1 Tax=[Phormidium] sp. ETS-05 TaxID=222819 RepID=UPI0018EEDDA4|nr:C40 family peptidase [[Phormidium] sp. ETS-05]
MVSLAEIRLQAASSSENHIITTEYRSQVNLNLYDAPTCESLATQAAAGRHLRIFIPSGDNGEHLLTTGDIPAIRVQLVEDDYPGWLAVRDLEHLEPAPEPDQAPVLSREDIAARLDAVIAFTLRAIEVPNQYLWGGTVAPNYDCSGLMQAAFASEGIRLPRDAYQQEAFTQAIPLAELEPGDLIFFGTPERATHVALYLGDGRYIHSSGKQDGRNGIGIDTLNPDSHPVSQFYYQRLRGAGRVMTSYLPG